jgi:glycosyltransferase involved in cell wall biosynthesis
VDVERVAPELRLRIAVLADFEGPHARSWLRYFIDRGHDVHAVSVYDPSTPIEGAKLHALRRRTEHAETGQAGVPVPPRRWALAERAPRGLVRVGHAMRYRLAGLSGVLRRIEPDVFHAHFLVEHGFYGAVAGVRPFVATAWGSDVFVEPRRDIVSGWIARWVARRADLVTANNAHMAARIGEMGVLPAKVAVITLGADRYDLERTYDSVNTRDGAIGGAPLIISTRAHERLYNIADIIRAHEIVVKRSPDARLVIAHGGSQSETLRASAGANVEFVGHLDRARFRDALAEADIFVSVPSSDATSVALLQAMAAGAFPIVSDLPSQREWIRHGENGLLVPVRDASALATAIERALDDGMLRRTAAELNRRIVEERGLNETQMAKMEEWYWRLAGKL